MSVGIGDLSQAQHHVNFKKCDYTMRNGFPILVTDKKLPVKNTTEDTHIIDILCPKAPILTSRPLGF